jgi:hypothetical protein
MKLFGYIDGNDDQLFKLSEVTLQAEPKALESVANFLLKCAKEMEGNDSWEHEHFSDSVFASDVLPDIIVFREK